MPLEPIKTPNANAPTSSELIDPLCAIFRRALKAENLKYTPERAQILDTIIAFDTLFEADQLLDTLKEQGHSVSKATVYRTLKLLESAGIIQHVLVDREQSHYQLAIGQTGNTLLIDTETGHIISTEVPELIELRDKICAAHGLTAQAHKLQIFVSKIG
ncbi:MAG: Fur family transcriptional regulator [Phycisphaerales bacterium]